MTELRPTERIAELIAALEDYHNALAQAVKLVQDAGASPGEAGDKLFNLGLMVQVEYLLARPLQTQTALIEARALYTPERKRHNERMRLRALKKKEQPSAEGPSEA